MKINQINAKWLRLEIFFNVFKVREWSFPVNAPQTWHEPPWPDIQAWAALKQLTDICAKLGGAAGGGCCVVVPTEA